MQTDDGDVIIDGVFEIDDDARDILVTNYSSNVTNTTIDVSDDFREAYLAYLNSLFENTSYITDNRNGENIIYTWNNISFISKFEALFQEFVPYIMTEQELLYVSISVAVSVGVLNTIGITYQCIKMYDIFFVSFIALYALYTWDFISDIILATYIYVDVLNGHKNLLTLFIFSIIFIILPWIVNIITLNKFQKKWQNSELHGSRYKVWLNKHGTLLTILTFLSGNCVGPIYLMNSNLFGFRMFSFGLIYKDKQRIRMTRFYHTILIENIPQLIIQIVYAKTLGKVYPITIISLVSSLLSVFVSIWNYLTHKTRVNSKDNEVLFTFKVTSHHGLFKQYLKRFKHRTNKLSRNIATIFPLPPHCIEVLLPVNEYSHKNIDGLQINMLITSKLKTAKELHDDIIKAMKRDYTGQSLLSKKFNQAWRLINVNFTIYDVTYKVSNAITTPTKNEVNLAQYVATQNISPNSSVNTPPVTAPVITAKKSVDGQPVALKPQVKSNTTSVPVIMREDSYSDT